MTFNNVEEAYLVSNDHCLTSELSINTIPEEKFTIIPCSMVKYNKTNGVSRGLRTANTAVMMIIKT